MKRKSLSWEILKFFKPLCSRQLQDIINKMETIINQPVTHSNKQILKDNTENEDLDEFNNEDLSEDYGTYDSYNKGK